MQIIIVASTTTAFQTWRCFRESRETWQLIDFSKSIPWKQSKWKKLLPRIQDKGCERDYSLLESCLESNTCTGWGYQEDQIFYSQILSLLWFGTEKCLSLQPWKLFRVRREHSRVAFIQFPFCRERVQDLFSIVFLLSFQSKFEEIEML